MPETVSADNQSLNRRLRKAPSNWKKSFILLCLLQAKGKRTIACFKVNVPVCMWVCQVGALGCTRLCSVPVPLFINSTWILLDYSATHVTTLLCISQHLKSTF